jgi:hypothetical protein
LKKSKLVRDTPLQHNDNQHAALLLQSGEGNDDSGDGQNISSEGYESDNRTKKYGGW